MVMRPHNMGERHARPQLVRSEKRGAGGGWGAPGWRAMPATAGANDVWRQHRAGRHRHAESAAGAGIQWSPSDSRSFTTSRNSSPPHLATVACQLEKIVVTTARTFVSLCANFYFHHAMQLLLLFNMHILSPASAQEHHQCVAINMILPSISILTIDMVNPNFPST